MAVAKKRLDVLLVERGMVETRAKAQGVIMAGEVLVNGTVVDKPGAHYADDVEVTLKARPQYVSRGGEKLAGALNDFQFDASGHIAADVGASTGGFTDCLLQHGAARVYAIDVGYGQLAHKLRTDARVVVLERTNARYLETLPEPVTLAVIDASFISLRLILPAVKKWLAAQADIIALIKPQFEAGRDDVGKGGVVRRREVHERVIHEVIAHAQEAGFAVAGLTVSSLKGPAGNIEFLVWLRYGHAPADALDLDALLEHLLPAD
jgi:23S rRNA (cytidine1920-2'-O)/16S rRNA (cytidine1409-2'-O)-methyltransferase